MSMPRLHRRTHSTHRREHRHSREDASRRSSSSHATAEHGRTHTSDRHRHSERSSSSRHRSSSRSSTNGRNASALCVMAASLAFMVTVIAELIAHSNQEPPLFALSLLAGLFAVAALATGGYAQVVQLTRWSRRVRNRLLASACRPACSCWSWLRSSMYKQQAPGGRHRPHPVPPHPAPLIWTTEDRSLFSRAGTARAWSNGVQVVVTSFEENAAESRAFNRNTSEPVTYATLTIINLGNPQPVTLARTRVTLLLESGEEVPSMDVKPLLRLSALDDQMRQRLTEPRMIAPGMMAADIPICLSSQFRWERASCQGLVSNR